MKSKNPKIYFIGGQARHGKDLVGKIIYDIYKKQGRNALILQYTSSLKEYIKKITDWDGTDETKNQYRDYFNHIGTNIIRGQIDPEFFVKRMVDDIKIYSFYFDVIIISDVRFKIEIDIPRKHLDNIVAINVIRPNFDNGLTIEQKNHSTEADLLDYNKFDYEIINDKEIIDLETRVSEIIREVEHES